MSSLHQIHAKIALCTTKSAKSPSEIKPKSLLQPDSLRRPEQDEHGRRAAAWESCVGLRPAGDGCAALRPETELLQHSKRFHREDLRGKKKAEGGNRAVSI